MPDSPSDVEQLDKEIPGFEKQYTSNFNSIGSRRLEQNISPLDMQHLHHEVVDITLKDIDKLTGTLKREALMERGEEIANELLDLDQTDTLGFIDVDKMKDINTEWEHHGGDVALRMIGQALVKSLRSSDLVGRYGGDEFVIIFRNLRPEEAKKIIEERVFPSLAKGVNISVGLKKMIPGNFEQTRKQADSKMFDIKDLAHETKESQVGIIEEENDADHHAEPDPEKRAA